MLLPKHTLLLSSVQGIPIECLAARLLYDSITLNRKVTRNRCILISNGCPHTHSHPHIHQHSHTHAQPIGASIVNWFLRFLTKMFNTHCNFFATHCCGCLLMRVPRPFQHYIYAHAGVVVALARCITSCPLFVLLTEVLILRTTDAFLRHEISPKPNWINSSVTVTWFSIYIVE